VAILPEGMSRERFDWLARVAGEVIKTPGSESNVKEIFDKCWELRRSGSDVVIFNQFDEFGNYLWHYSVTGPAMVEVLDEVMGDGDRFAGLFATTGSAGTIASGDYLKQEYPQSVVAAGEALQCPTLLLNGFGEHRIEGIGDKHVPWIHNVRNTDMLVALDDEAPMALMRLFNEPVGIEYLAAQGVPADLLAHLPELGISGIGNLLGAVKMARYYELGTRDVVMTVLTDSMEMYSSRIDEARRGGSAFSETDAAIAWHRHLLGQSIEFTAELGYWDRKRVHNLKYFTWVEQQGKDSAELTAQWDPEYWEQVQSLPPRIDELIDSFNDRVGTLTRR
jgi:cysteine synthase